MKRCVIPDAQPITRINVTPIIDVALVLVIILMVTAQYAADKDSIPMELPKAASGGDAVESTINVMMTHDGQILFDGSPVTKDQLTFKVKGDARVNPKVQAVIAADKGVPYGKVVQVIDVVKGNGVKSFALNVEREAGE